MEKISISKADACGWKWPKWGITDNHLSICRGKVNLFAKEHYDGDIVELWRDTHPLYMSMATKLTEKEISVYEKRNEAIIKKYGWAQYAWSSLEQGWWHFVDYIINKNQQ